MLLSNFLICPPRALTLTSFNNLINFHKKLSQTLNFLLYMRTKEDVGLKFTNNQGHRSRIEGNEKKLPQ